MKIRGKLISSFGAVTLAILLVYSGLVYISFSESIRQDRTAAYSNKIKAAVLATEMQIWQHRHALLHGSATGPVGLHKVPLFSGLRVLTFDDRKDFTFQALEKAAKMQLPASWKSSEIDRILAQEPQLLSEGGRTILLQFQIKGKGLTCSLFTVNQARLIALLRHSLLLEKSKLFLSRDMKLVMELASYSLPDEESAPAVSFEDLKRQETFRNHQQGEFLPLSEKYATIGPNSTAPVEKHEYTT